MNSKYFVSLICLLLSGCYQTLPPNWSKDLPGLYEGKQSGFREVIDFKPDGTFYHEVFLNESSLAVESGTWAIPQNQFLVELKPFKQFYDPINNAFSTTNGNFGFYEFRPLPDGKTFSNISASVDFKYVLVRKHRN
jgi:hypothetical protein